MRKMLPWRQTDGQKSEYRAKQSMDSVRLSFAIYTNALSFFIARSQCLKFLSEFKIIKESVTWMVTYKVVIRLSGLWINNLFPFLSLKPTYRTPSHDFHVNDTGATWVKFHGISSTIGNVTTTPAAATARKSGADADTNTKQIIRQIRFTNPEEIGHFY